MCVCVCVCVCVCACVCVCTCASAGVHVDVFMRVGTHARVRLCADVQANAQVRDCYFHNTLIDYLKKCQEVVRENRSGRLVWCKRGF